MIVHNAVRHVIAIFNNGRRPERDFTSSQLQQNFVTRYSRIICQGQSTFCWYYRSRIIEHIGIVIQRGGIKRQAVLSIWCNVAPPQNLYCRCKYHYCLPLSLRQRYLLSPVPGSRQEAESRRCRMDEPLARPSRQRKLAVITGIAVAQLIFPVVAFIIGGSATHRVGTFTVIALLHVPAQFVIFQRSTG